MNEVELNTPEEVIKRFNELPNHFIFRGQSSAMWPLRSSLERVLGGKWSPENARKFEDYGLDLFQSKFHLYDGENIEPASRLAWLSLMQHYGAPTRLIDFTTSPFVALYFAMEGVNPQMLQAETRMAIIALDYSKLIDASLEVISKQDSKFKETRASIQGRQDEIFEQTVNRFSYDIAWVTEPGKINKRLDRQCGCFLLSGNREKRLEEVLALPAYRNVDTVKFTIPAKLYPNLFALLRKINLNSKTLYGDLQGLCRSIRMELQTYAN